MRVKKNNRISRRMDAFQIILYVIVAVYCLSMVYVLLFGLINSLKDATDFEWLNPFGFPHKEFGWKFDNYSKVLKEFKVSSMSMGGEEVGFMGMFVNSLLYAVFMSLFSMATQIMVAYAIAKYDFRLKPLLYGVAVIVMLLPIIGSLASEVQMADTFNFRNNLLGICLMKCKYAGLYFLVFYATFRSVSWTYAEAAQIDGAGHLKIFIEIMLPLIKSTVFAVFILLFIEFWNDYYTPMIFLPQSPTMSYGLFVFQTDNRASQPIQLAACLLTCLPILVLFVVFKNKIMGNVTMGGLKG
ncbi:MAG: carbohydrate ABC transporter permease [Candidatus Borkfalkiaceae bacterium]|nr:carbohydrate ABC transporter permease [Eubacteriales bacterium]MDY5820719.1 carbohydrate ABC transporter permease [Christensenellaceae bacterium]